MHDDVNIAQDIGFPFGHGAEQSDSVNPNLLQLRLDLVKIGKYLVFVGLHG